MTTLTKDLADVSTNDSTGDFCLNSVFEIEDALVMVRDLSRKIEFLKGLKKHRADQIDAEISETNRRVDNLRTIILKTMVKHEPDQKTLQFPSIGKVTRRVGKDDWKFDDEEAMKKFFEKKGVKDDVIKVKESLDARAAKSVIDHFAKNGIDVPGVSKKVGEEGISITFDAAKKSSAKATKTKADRTPSTSKSARASLDDLDDLEV
jgi:hypothetical protein